MFGYVTANKPEMKIREFARYRGFYCGLCRTLKKKYGRLGQMTLTYDMTFLVLLLTSLYEPATEEARRRCLIHPGKRQYMLTNEASAYAADMNILLSHDHFKDDWEDERKLSGLLGMKAFSRKRRRVAAKYPRQAEAVESSLAELARRERENCADIDAAAKPFGTLMAELFVWREDAFQDILRQFGFYLGKFIYLMDAVMDLEQDRRKGCYNPILAAREMVAGGEMPAHTRKPENEGTGAMPACPRKPENEKEAFHEKLQEMLDNTLKMAIIEFEKLPCEQDLAVLRNILYEGIWTKYNQKKTEAKAEAGERAL